MKSEEFERFIESWGSLGVLWGINRSMARVHAFLILSEDPVDLDTVAKELKMSRGNASMSLKELRNNWRVIERVHVSGDRRDYYISEADAWKMFFRIGLERKKREFDPALHALRRLISEADIENRRNIKERLKNMESLLSTFERIAQKFLENEEKSKSVLAFLESFIRHVSKSCFTAS